MSESGFSDFEFERKFFVRDLPAVTASDPSPALIVQAYLFAADGYAVRVRVQGPAPADLSHPSIDLVEALGTDAIGTMTAKGPATGWVVDRFLDANAPLLLAEVERGGPVVDLAIPAFCATEVSEDDRFRNEYLAHQPYGTWADAHLREFDLLGPKFVTTLGQNNFDDA
ncbi:hypothetical protein [Mycolicibacterium sp. CBMA 361]|uniref:hypothetical protein n=1 Tax=Mycolicibacterium sp. CBMA 361 TaxID=2606610 RepID=UPI0012DE0104|nr:hypothetical protein [Mycolicibacterium sp. CBMA 361]MUM34127.1 hypothetical protein [Mycolicibacterium sp. CBMA 361]